MFYVGQKVCCVDASGVAAPYLREGEVYTVSKVGILKTGLPGLDVKGIPTVGRFDVNWRRDRFRPVVERKTDISIFTEMLHRRVVEVDA